MDDRYGFNSCVFGDETAKSGAGNALSVIEPEYSWRPEQACCLLVGTV